MILFHTKKRPLPLRSSGVVQAGFSEGSSRVLEAVEEKGKWDAMRGWEKLTWVPSEVDMGLLGNFPVKWKATSLILDNLNQGSYNFL